MEITIQEAAKKLGIGVNSVQVYLARGSLEGDTRRGVVTLASVEIRQDDLLKKRTKYHDTLRLALKRDDLTERERLAVTMRVMDGAIFAEIGEELKMSRQGAQLVIKRVIERVQKDMVAETK